MIKLSERDVEIATTIVERVRPDSMLFPEAREYVAERLAQAREEGPMGPCVRCAKQKTPNDYCHHCIDELMNVAREEGRLEGIEQAAKELDLLADQLRGLEIENARLWDRVEKADALADSKLGTPGWNNAHADYQAIRALAQKGGKS